VKLIASPKTPLNVITSQKVGSLKSGLPIQFKIQNIQQDNFEKGTKLKKKKQKKKQFPMHIIRG
jgi:hypothetical protein